MGRRILRAIGHASEENFPFDRCGVISDGKCVMARQLPGCDIAEIQTGRRTPGEEELGSARTVVGER